MLLNTLSNVSMLTAAILAFLNILFYNSVKIGSVDIFNYKKYFTLRDNNEQNVKIPYVFSIIILILLLVNLLGLLLGNKRIVILICVILSITVFVLSIVSIIYFSNLKLNDSYNLNIGKIINIKKNERGILLVQITNYLFFSLSIISSFLYIISSKTR